MTVDRGLKMWLMSTAWSSFFQDTGGQHVWTIQTTTTYYASIPFLCESFRETPNFALVTGYFRPLIFCQQYSRWHRGKKVNRVSQRQQYQTGPRTMTANRITRSRAGQKKTSLFSIIIEELLAKQSCCEPGNWFSIQANCSRHLIDIWRYTTASRTNSMTWIQFITCKEH